jgi:hypothetical protein
MGPEDEQAGAQLKIIVNGEFATYQRSFHGPHMDQVANAASSWAVDDIRRGAIVVGAVRMEIVAR